jgi:hypothetical protein
MRFNILNAFSDRPAEKEADWGREETAQAVSCVHAGRKTGARMLRDIFKEDLDDHQPQSQRYVR